MKTDFNNCDTNSRENRLKEFPFLHWCCAKQILAALLLPLCAFAGEPPAIPVGLDAYRQWERWPVQRIGVRAYMRSTYDRRGANEGADASHFLYQLANDRNVTLDVEGNGVLYFARYNHWHGSPWHYEVDGVDHIVKETTSADPNHPVENSVFIPEELFQKPLAWTWSDTKGADLSWVPIPFEKKFRMQYSRTHYGTGYYIYHLYDPGARLSKPIRDWDWKTSPDKDAFELIARAGTDIDSFSATRAAFEKQKVLTPFNLSFSTLTNSKPSIVAAFTNGPAMLRQLTFIVSREHAEDFGRARLRVTWDGRAQPSIDAPVALFFGAGTLYNRAGREFLVKGFPVHVRFNSAEVQLACFFPMPFFRSARIELVGEDGKFIPVRLTTRTAPLTDPPNHLGYFHATYRDFPKPESGKDFVLLDTRETEGGGDWSGSFVGTSFIFSHNATLGTLEGDPRFFFDDSQTPQAQGTGTEEWGGGGDYWGGENMTLPFAGHPCGAKSLKEVKNDEDKIESAYRFLLADLFPFGKNAVIRLEHGGENKSTEHYETVTYWYGAPHATLVKTDELKIADESSEKAHSYFSPDASAPYEITSRYELGVDTLDGKEIFPVQTDHGRKTAGVSEFTLNLRKDNLGVLLRRKLDYSFPNQRAEVFVASERDGKIGKWKSAGIWYLAGANTCIYSNPRDELGAALHNVQTSNRRFRDDEFLIPRKLTEGKDKIRVRIRFTPVKIPLYPGQPLPELAWSEIAYTAYCYVLPEWKIAP